MDRILFIVPPNIAFSDFVTPPQNVATVTLRDSRREFGSVLTDIPLGIISLSAYLKQFLPLETRSVDFNVQLLRESDFSYPDFKSYFLGYFSKSELKSFDPTVICISAQFTPSYHSVIDISEVCRQCFPNGLILAGGNLITAMYAELLKDTDCVDAVCYGEGELPLLDLLRASDRQSLLATHSSWISRNKAAYPTGSFKHQFIEDLDEIPFLDYDILDLEGYRLNPTLARYSVGSSQGNAMAIMTSRGCPFKCTFCASHRTHGRKMRYQSVDRVAADLDQMIARYSVGAVIVQDDHFMGGEDRRPYRIVEAARDRQLSIFFQNALAIYALERPFLELLKSAGIDELVLPIESGSARVLKELMHKPLKLDIVRRVVADCREVGIYTDCNIIVGMPGETLEDIEDSRRFLKTIDGDWFRVFIATPIPGSDMHSVAVEGGYFVDSPVNANYKRAVIETPDWSAETIQQISYAMNIELNFVCNTNMRLGNYTRALECFESVLRVKADHAIAWFYAGVCLEMLDEPVRAGGYFERARLFAASSDFWMPYIKILNIPVFER